MFKKITLFIMIFALSYKPFCLAMDDKGKEEMHDTSHAQENEVTETREEQVVDSPTQALVKILRENFVAVIESMKKFMPKPRVDLKKIANLLVKGADFNALVAVTIHINEEQRREFKLPPFCCALFCEDVQLLKLLLDHQIDLNISCIIKHHCKVKCKDHELSPILMLISHLKAPGSSGKTIPAMLDLLLAQGCDKGLFELDEPSSMRAVGIIFDAYYRILNLNDTDALEKKILYEQCFEVISKYILKKNTLTQELDKFDAKKSMQDMLKLKPSSWNKAFATEPDFVQLLKERINDNDC